MAAGAGCVWDSCLPCCLCFATFLVCTWTLRFHQVCCEKECRSSVTLSPLWALHIPKLHGTAEWVPGERWHGVWHTRRQRLAFSYTGVISCRNIGIICYTCRNRRKVFNLSSLLSLHFSAESFLLTTEAILRYWEVPSLNIHIWKAAFMRMQVKLNGWFTQSMIRVLSLDTLKFVINVLQRLIW